MSFMRHFIGTLLTIVCSLCCYGQSNPPDYCNFLELIFNNDSCKKLLETTKTHLDRIVILDDEQRLIDCQKLQIGGRYVPVETYHKMPKTPHSFYSIGMRRKEEGQYEMLVKNVYRHCSLIAFFIKENQKWIISSCKPVCRE